MRIRVVLGLVLLLAACVRLAGLASVPPGLWYDEAIYALDGLEAATDGPRLFYTTQGHMREPLYIWSLGAFFAAFGHSVAMARLVSALWGIAAVALLWPVARRALHSGTINSGEGAGALWDARWWPVIAVGVMAVFRWHVHFSRTIFRALLPSLFLLLLVWLVFRWRERRSAADAALAGAVLGAGIYTYLSWRLVPLLMLLWAAWLLWRGQLQWRRDRSHLALMAGAALLVFAPLGVDWVLHPEHFSGRTDEVSMFAKTVRTAAPDGTVRDVVVAKSVAEAAVDLARNALQIAGMWTFRGDHVGKHNLPHEPVFDWASGLVFYAGLVWCVLNAVRSEWAFLCLAWIGVLSLTSVFSFGAPNILRMQGMVPAVVLVYVFGLRWVAELAGRAGMSVAVRRVAVGALLLLFAAVQLTTYFLKFPRHPAVRQEFQVEMFAAPAQAVSAWAQENSGNAYLPEELAAHPSVRFITAGLPNVKTFTPAEDLPTTGPRPRAFLLTARSVLLSRQGGRDQSLQLEQARGTRLLRKFPLTPPPAPGGAARPPQMWAELWELK